MKRIVLIVVFAALLIFLAGCKKNVEEEVSESIAESFMEDSGNGDMDMGGTVVVKNEDGSEVSYGSTQWPTSDLVKDVPVCKSGLITGTVDSEEYSTIYMEEVKEKDALEYLRELKQKFSHNSYEVEADDIISYGGENSNGIAVVIYYDISSESISISVSKVTE
ncbi:hypothetical protein GCM10023142_30550 [Anaerocolumna aminovalerica]|uniref:DUF6591 domain-containing protein n=1 Tax=Anaerocolumna aminovalerica TaxID=1527 RepID=A0A1I5HYF8_9FIRM|nr:DUF6591 domain-containing protein [Anaerocolumna aminovalerica]MDU6265618.1 DUF6591 domain-containing protein [Anaerocolumna aminovalerica]SFO53020.1 hypothetical protein SAMN04489757_13634 [Anaerocolumna aminovalerica]